MSESYQICTRCVMDTFDPDITFDENGVCNHCRRAEELLLNQTLTGEEGLRKLHEIANIIKTNGRKKEYDCIIGVSGGVDSSYLLYVAKELMGLRPLAVHIDAGWNSELAVKNIENLVKGLDIDLFTYVVNWEEMRDLQLAYLKASVANQDSPQDHAFFAKLYEFAIKNDIRYVLTGSNFTSESILPKSWGYNAMDKTQICAIHKKFGNKKLRTFPMVSFSQYYFYYPYIRKMRRIAPLNYIGFNKYEAMKELENKFGWQYYGGKHYESRWTKFFQSYYLPVKFGYDKRKAHLSSVIVSGQLSRDEAIKELENPPFNPKEIIEDKEFVAKKLKISSQELDNLISLPNKTYLDYKHAETFTLFLRKLKQKFKH